MRPGEEPREEWRAAGAAVLQDIAADGRVLLRRDERQGGTLLITPEIEDPVDLSWLDQSQAVGVSVESGTLLLRDAGGMYLRGLDGSPAVRLGGGRAVALSRDGQVAIDMGSPDRVELIPTGIGTPREIEHPGIESYFAWFHPDGRRLLINGRESGGTWRFFELNLDGTGATVAVGPDNLEHYIGQQPLSNDGRWLLGFPLPGHEDTVYSLQGEDPIRVQGLGPGEVVIRFTEDDRAVYVFNRDGLPVRIYRLDYRTGARQLWREFMPGDPAGVAGVPTVVMTADGRVMAFNYQRVLSTLFEISGLQ
jgi:DNA-binding beta-propeller fold protein YncE